MVKSLFSLALLLAAAAGCGKTLNPDRCCIDAADCAQLGLDEESHLCGEGLACVANECVVASCSTQGCTATAPVCDIQTDVCQGCGGDADCDRFTEQPVCAVDTGACVECVGDGDCSANAPICDANACRGCQKDDECASGACGDSGACVPEPSVVYLDPGGTDAGTCTQGAPCRTLPFAVSKATANRTHLVMNTGAYAIQSFYEIRPDQTSAAELVLHGHGSSLVAPMFEGVKLDVAVPMTIRDLTISIEVGRGIHLAAGARYRLERVKLRSNATALEIDGDATLRDFMIDVPPERGGTRGLVLGSAAALTMERGTIRGYATAITSTEAVTINATNVLIFDAPERALELPAAQGSLNFVTIADSGTDAGTGPRAVQCGASMTIRNSIIWAPGTTTRVPVSGCNLVSSIAGPTAIAGIPNTDPLFVDRASRDYHLRADSPAKDVATAGPDVDFERDPRPRGPRFDLGADEAP